ncbi:D-alanyl-D-alanine carboxypeptidase/D-alanyl-D-alanine-endopeptidase [Gillisia sp. M10.2A]|uniref:D-alanyl-D-alanine carboxypeptidase/D-alanyl-D-alanine-endopeptidase n=1 Tax=Gillisia lutea TaxID=2909668 RepID=A0ABS9EKI2_9FLAO|nr:D-alanyl-D-alanine carboxypeptidase/D-alanyl-D-alanine-endopeptidase [Gillisia lutea]MCF4102315.1 D-alanyl-D-alanine carboxypeptidase/D-alanyl-D-alanine-endopeptidase [Gillisia lutea]
MKNIRSLLSRHIQPLSLIISLFILASCSSTKRFNRTLESDFRHSDTFNQSFSGFALMDPDNNKMLYEYNSQKYFTPASNVKLLTFYAGLKVLGDSLPALKYIVQNDSLIFRGTGDPSFLYTDAPESKVYDFLKNRTEELYYQPSAFTEESFGPGWSWDDYNYYYSVERAAFPIYGNYVEFKWNSGQEKPSTYIKQFNDSLLLSKNITEIKRDLDKNTFRYHPSQSGKKTSQIVPFKYTPELFTKLLSDTLQKPVKLVNSELRTTGTEKTLYSLPADSLYKTMLRNSDNFIAEQLLLMVANKVSDTLKTDNAIKYIKTNYLNDLPDEPIWVDGSGLSRYNLVTPRSMVGLLKKISEEIPQDKLFDYLPSGGETGTLKNWYKADVPYIFAKTGTLSNNHNLSGYIKTKSGKILLFSFMNNNYTVSSSVIKTEMQRILRSIYLNY